MGSNFNSIAVSTKALRHLEYDRLIVTSKVSCKSFTPHPDEEELQDTLDVQLLANLVGEFTEGGLDEAMQSSLYDLRASHRKSKANSSKKNNKISPRKKAKISTSPIVSR